MTDRIAWTTWNENGPQRTSAAHVENPTNPGVALCGTRIPADGNATELCNGEDADRDCKRCDKIEADITEFHEAVGTPCPLSCGLNS